MQITNKHYDLKYEMSIVLDEFEIRNLIEEEIKRKLNNSILFRKDFTKILKLKNIEINLTHAEHNELEANIIVKFEKIIDKPNGDQT